MNKKQENGFTLVELLAVIVILAIILVIAVPKVMDVIKDSKKATIESTAKLIAGTAEKAKLQNQILGNNKEINCEDIVKINDVDYESCEIEFDGDTAKVTLVGSGKFEGLNVCNGTKTKATTVNTSCSEVCGVNEMQETHIYVPPYEVDNASLCEKFFVEKGVIEKNEANTICTGGIAYIFAGEAVYSFDFDGIIRDSLKEGYITKEELENYRTIVKPYEVEDIPSCISILTEKITAAGGADLVPSVELICNGSEVEGYDFDKITTELIGAGEFTEDELVENNVIKVEKVIKSKEIEEVKVCMPKKPIKLSTFLTKIVEDENARKAFGLEKTTATYNGKDYDAGIRYIGKKEDVKNKVYYNCDDKDANNVSYGEENYNYESSCEVWRIIGVFNTKSSTNATAVPRVKIINTESTFNASWDSSTSDVNDGWGINQWGESKYSNGDPYEGADLMRLLNGYYIGKSGSTCRYCNVKEQETCEQVCDIEDNTLASQKMKPLTNTAKNMIENAVWDTYAVKVIPNSSNILSWETRAYLEEKGISAQYTGISECSTCRDTVNRTTSWTGLVGLMSVSDTVYADGWLYTLGETSSYSWSISPCASSDDANTIYGATYGVTLDNPGYYSQAVWPALYLKPNIQIIGGDGQEEPYRLKS